MADLLDELTCVAKTDCTDVVDELRPDKPIMECPYVCCMRTNTVYIDHPHNKLIIDQLRSAIEATRDVELLSDFEINCHAEHQRCGSVPRWMFTDESVYICFGLNINFRNVTTLKRFLKNIVNGSWRNRLYRYGYGGILVHKNLGKKYESERFYYVESDILEKSKRLTTYDEDVRAQYKKLFQV